MDKINLSSESTRMIRSLSKLARSPNTTDLSVVSHFIRLETSAEVLRLDAFEVDQDNHAVILVRHFGETTYPDDAVISIRKTSIDFPGESRGCAIMFDNDSIIVDAGGSVSATKREYLYAWPMGVIDGMIDRCHDIEEKYYLRDDIMAAIQAGDKLPAMQSQAKFDKSILLKALDLITDEKISLRIPGDITAPLVIWGNDDPCIARWYGRDVPGIGVAVAPMIPSESLYANR